MPVYRPGDVVVYRPRGPRDCYSPVVRPWARWPSPFWHADPGMARPGDRMAVVKVDVVAGRQRLWYESPYATYGPAPEYQTPAPGQLGCHNVLEENVRPTALTRIALFFRGRRPDLRVTDPAPDGPQRGA